MKHQYRVASFPKRIVGITGLLAASLLLIGCATQTDPPVQEAPGFFMGLLHGFLIFFGFIGSLFTDYRIYAFPNGGLWYDLGYLIGASAFLSGSGASGSRRSCKAA